MIPSLCLVILTTVELAIGHPIVHGVLPRDPSQFSFAVSLQRALGNGTLVHFCGGIYLGKGWILTANHCIVGSEKKTAMYAHIGGHPLMGTASVVRRIRQMVSHPDYNRVTLGSDIALLRIDLDDALQQIDKSVQSTLLLPSKGNSNSKNVAGFIGIGVDVLNLVQGDNGRDEAAEEEECHIFGYGSDSFYGPTSNRLQYGVMQPLPFDRCVQMLGPVVAPATPNSGMFCAIGLSDACRGDSGGGLVCRRKIWRPLGDGKIPYYLRGIISYGAGCGAPASPGVFTDVGFYRAWIDGIIAASDLPYSNA